MGDQEKALEASQRIAEAGMKILEAFTPVVETFAGMRRQLVEEGFTPEQASEMVYEIVLDTYRRNRR